MCDFVLTKRNDLGKGFAYVYYLATSSSQQTVVPGDTIKYNLNGKLTSIALSNNDTLTMLKSGMFQFDFSVNFVNNISNIEVIIYVNDEAVLGTTGISTPLVSGVSKVSGSYVLRLAKGDTIKLVNVGESFRIARSGINSEIVTSVTLAEI